MDDYVSLFIRFKWSKVAYKGSRGISVFMITWKLASISLHDRHVLLIIIIKWVIIRRDCDEASAAGTCSVGKTTWIQFWTCTTLQTLLRTLFPIRTWGRVIFRHSIVKRPLEIGIVCLEVNYFVLIPSGSRVVCNTHHHRALHFAASFSTPISQLVGILPVKSLCKACARTNFAVNTTTKAQENKSCEVKNASKRAFGCLNPVDYTPGIVWDCKEKHLRTP